MQWLWRESKMIVLRSTDLHCQSRSRPACIQTFWLWWENVGQRNPRTDSRLMKSPKFLGLSTKESKYSALSKRRFHMRCALRCVAWRWRAIACARTRLRCYVETVSIEMVGRPVVFLYLAIAVHATRRTQCAEAQRIRLNNTADCEAFYNSGTPSAGNWNCCPFDVNWPGSG